MKPKAIILLMACWLSFQAALAQPWVAWMRLYQSPASNSPTDGALDPWGNIVAFGHDPHQGRSRATIIKYRPNGEMAWLRRHVALGGLSTLPYKIRIDREGGILISTEVVKANEEFCIELAKYDKDGNLVWRLRYDTGHVHDTFSDMALDQEGNVYVTGDWHTFDVPVSRQAFAIKVSSEGRLVWETRLDYDWPYSRASGKIAVSSDGSLVGVAANIFLGYDELRRALGSDTVVWRMNGAGEVMTSTRLAAPHSPPRLISHQGGTAIAGRSIVVGGILTVTPKPENVFEGKAPWLAAVGQRGEIAWFRVYDFHNGNGTGAFNNILYRRNGSIIVTGFTKPSNLLTVSHSINGDVDWKRLHHSPNFGIGGIFIREDTFSRLYVCTDYADRAPAATRDFGAIAYDALGGIAWMYRFDGQESNYDNPFAFAIDDRGSVYVVGGTVWDWRYLDDWITIKLCQRWGDANDDGRVDAADLEIVLERFGQTATPGRDGDVTDDGFVDDADLALVLWMFGTTCP